MAALEVDRQRRTAAAEENRLRDLYENLSPREREIMGLVTAGLMNKQVAGRLDLSEITVKIHRGNVMRKMGAHRSPTSFAWRKRSTFATTPRRASARRCETVSAPSSLL